MQQVDSPAARPTPILKFHGKGSEFFGVYIVNMLLSLITFGLYYPWAKVNILRYTYGATDMEGSRFTFHGTGKELFIGMIKAVVILGVVGGIYFALLQTNDAALIAMGILFLYTCIGLLTPVAIHGSVKYRSSRSSWRGVHFRYLGHRATLVKMFIKEGLLTLITFGIYGAWMVTNLRRYVVGNLRFGNIKFGYDASGSNYFGVMLGGLVLTYITLGIYGFWYARDLYRFWINHLYLEQDGQYYRLRSTATGGGFFKLYVGNFFIVVFTLGLGTPWAIIRTLRFTLENAVMLAKPDFTTLVQTDQEYKNAAGEELADALDLDLL